MSNLDNINEKIELSLLKDLDKFKEYVEEANSINQLAKLTGINKSRLRVLLKEYNLKVVPRCLYCGNMLPKASSGTNKKYCDNKCSYLHKLQEKPCKACGKLFKAPKGVKYCSEKCKSKGYNTTSSSCEWCGKQYMGHKASKYCSDKCRINAYSLSSDNTYKVCEACGRQYIGDYGCSSECRDYLAKERAKNLLIEVYGTNNKEEILKGMIKNG